jgi:hypothetical protein
MGAKLLFLNENFCVPDAFSYAWQMRLERDFSSDFDSFKPCQFNAVDCNIAKACSGRKAVEKRIIHYSNFNFRHGNYVRM